MLPASHRDRGHGRGPPNELSGDLPAPARALSAVGHQPCCHVCGQVLEELWATATDTDYGTTSERFEYYLCPRCDALSIDPMPADRLEQIYPPTYYSFASGDSSMGLAGAVKRRIDARGFRRVLGALDHPRPSILDVGGGTGEITAGFVRQAGPGSRGTVIDIDAGSLDAARARGLDAWQGRFEDFETEERFDLVLMLNLIEHVPDPVAVLAKARSLLSERGLIWMQTPNFRALDARIFRHLNWSGYHCPRHFVLFSEAGLPRVLANAGLEQVELRRTQGAPFWAGSICGLRRRHDPTVAGALPKPLVLYRSFAPLAAAGAAFDFATRRFRQVSQVMVVARAA